MAACVHPQQIARVNLLSGLLKTVSSNTSMPLPIKVFEISDVVLLDPSKEVGARNERRLGAVIFNKSPGFEVGLGWEEDEGGVEKTCWKTFAEC